MLRQKRLRRLTVIGAVAIAAMAARPAAALDAEGARTVVGGAARDAIDAFAGRKLATGEAEARFKGLLDKYLDVPTESQRVLGRFWASATPAQQREFAGLFENFMVVAYGGMIDGVPAGLSIDVGRAEAKDDGFLVHSLIGTGHQPDGTEVDWMVATAPGGRPVITDIMVDGIGLMRTRKEEFGSILRAAGGRIEGLLQPIRSKLHALSDPAG